MKRILGVYERRGPGGRSNSSQVHQANATAATLSAVEILVSLVGHKDLPARSTGSCAGRPQAGLEVRGRFAFGPTKTGAGLRTATLPTVAAEAWPST
jgi:hypothetical protein